MEIKQTERVGIMGSIQQLAHTFLTHGDSTICTAMCRNGALTGTLQRYRIMLRIPRVRKIPLTESSGADAGTGVRQNARHPLARMTLLVQHILSLVSEFSEPCQTELGGMDMQTYNAIVSRISSMLVHAGINKENIKEDYLVWVGVNKPFTIDIAIVNNEDCLDAVFEIKTAKCVGRDKDRVLRTVKLFVSLGLNVPFFIVCNEKVAQVVAGKELEWHRLEQLEPLIKESIALRVPKSVKSISDYLCEIKKKKWQLQQRMKKNGIVKYFFRGQRDSGWDLLPSLFRGCCRGGVLKGKTLCDEAEYLILEAMRMFPSAFAECNNYIDQLSIAQHHEIPTRLLDVTGNALVALYFAAQTSNGNISHYADSKSTEEEKDGRVFVFGATLQDYKNALKNIEDDSRKAVEYCKKEKRRGVAKNKPQLVFSSLRLPRQTMQDSAFYIFENEDKSPSAVCNFEEGDFAEIIIDKNAKNGILRELKEACNISKGRLFPESLSAYKDRMIDDAWKRVEIGAEIDEYNKYR